MISYRRLRVKVVVISEENSTVVNRIVRIKLSSNIGCYQQIFDLLLVLLCEDICYYQGIG
jgi:hypothetical protein